jgi:adenylylsulfate kinase
MAKHIHPGLNQLVERKEKEFRLNQKAKVLWLTGLSGAGKSTVAAGVEQKLFDQGFFPAILDGDNVRAGINKNLGFSLEDRSENIRRISEVAKLNLSNGIITITSFISPTIEIREMARQLIGEEDFIEIYINAPLEVCEQRDVKGLYGKARRGEIKDFTGIGSPYEPPRNPSLIIETANHSVKESIQEVFNFIHPMITLT